jgi:magnesium chelatase family protein
VLSADGKVPSGRLEKTVLLGELALDGRVRPVRGVLPAVIAAKREGFHAVVLRGDVPGRGCGYNPHLAHGVEFHPQK